MRHQIGQNISRVPLLEPIIVSYDICTHPQDVCSRGSTIYPHYRVGYDGQEQVLPAEHAVFILSQMLFISPDSNQDSPSGAKTKSYVRWYVQMHSHIYSHNINSDNNLRMQRYYSQI